MSRGVGGWNYGREEGKKVRKNKDKERKEMELLDTMQHNVRWFHENKDKGEID